MQVTYQQKQELLEKGYVIIPGVVPKIMLKEAMKAINHSIGKGISSEHKGANYCKELEKLPVITDLFNKTPAKKLCESLIGEGMFHPVGSGQIALRFPHYQDPPNVKGGAHLDGVLHVKEGIMQNFTALVGILLNDQPEPLAGNFIVYPGSHHLYEQYFKEHGPDILLKEVAFQTMHRSPNVTLPEPVQITGQAGDMVISHYQLVHAGGPNISQQIRYSSYFRLDHVDRHKDWKAPLTDMWLHWPGIREIMSNDND